jgi:hypothetical protein
MARRSVTVKLDDNGAFPLKALKPLIDVSKVTHYDLEVTPSGVVLRLYDSKGKLVKPKKVVDRKTKA